MSDGLVVLLVDGGRELETALREAIAAVPEARLVVARDVSTAFQRAHDDLPGALILGPTVDEAQAEQLVRAVQDRALGAPLEWTRAIARATPADRMRALNAGAESLLTWPPDATQVLEVLRRLARSRARAIRERAAYAELERLRADHGDGTRTLVDLLVRITDMAHPGAVERGDRRAQRAMEVAARFEIPERLIADLTTAARLYELGAVVAHPATAPGNRTEEERDGAESTASATLLDAVPGLAGVAEVIGLRGENWDGTGHPHHLQQGQIPLRSRILRVLVDLERALARARRPSIEEALAEMEAHAGTLYDPLVLVHLGGVLGARAEDADHHALRRVAVDELLEGMVLAEDLVTDAGVKLLSKGTRLSSPSLEALWRRHGLDPIVRGAVIEHD